MQVRERLASGTRPAPAVPRTPRTAVLPQGVSRGVNALGDVFYRDEFFPLDYSHGKVRLDAALSLRELADDYDIVLPRGAGYETLAGFTLDCLGKIPKGGESFAYEGRVYTVVDMDGLRVSKVKIEKLGSKGVRPKVAPVRPKGSPA